MPPESMSTSPEGPSILTEARRASLEHHEQEPVRLKGNLFGWIRRDGPPEPDLDPVIHIYAVKPPEDESEGEPTLLELCVSQSELTAAVELTKDQDRKKVATQEDLARRKVKFDDQDRIEEKRREEIAQLESDAKGAEVIDQYGTAWVIPMTRERQYALLKIPTITTDQHTEKHIAGTETGLIIGRWKQETEKGEKAGNIIIKRPGVTIVASPQEEGESSYDIVAENDRKVVSLGTRHSPLAQLLLTTIPTDPTDTEAEGFIFLGSIPHLSSDGGTIYVEDFVLPLSVLQRQLKAWKQEESREERQAREKRTGAYQPEEFKGIEPQLLDMMESVRKQFFQARALLLERRLKPLITRLEAKTQRWQKLSEFPEKIKNIAPAIAVIGTLGFMLLSFIDATNLHHLQANRELYRHCLTQVGERIERLDMDCYVSTNLNESHFWQIGQYGLFFSIALFGLPRVVEKLSRYMATLNQKAASDLQTELAMQKEKITRASRSTHEYQKAQDTQRRTS